MTHVHWAPMARPGAWMDAPGPEQAQTGAAAWTPPPRHGLVPLRPMTLGEQLSAVFRLFQTNASVTLGSAFVILAATTLIAVALPTLAMIAGAERSAAAIGDDIRIIEAGNVGLIILSVLTSAAIFAIGGSLMQAILSTAVAEGALGRKARIGEVWTAAAKRTLPVLILAVLQLLVLLIVGVALLGALIVPIALQSASLILLGVLLALALGFGVIALALWLGTRFCAATSAMVLEGAGVARGLVRSWRLTRGNFWRSFGTLYITRAIAQVATSVGVGALQMLVVMAMGLLAPLGTTASGQEPLLNAVMVVLMGLVFLVSTLVSAISLVLNGAAPAIVYLDLRMRNEGLNVAIARAVEARSEGRPAADPFLEAVAA